MATFKIELFTSDANGEGRHPIFLKVFHKGVPKRKNIGHAFKEEWDFENSKIRRVKSRPNYIADNIHIENEFIKYNAIFVNLKNSGKDWNPQDVFAEVPISKEEKTIKFFELTDRYLASLVPGSDTHEWTGSVKNKVERFAKFDFNVDDINESWISRFVLHCKTKEKNGKGGVGNSKSTINQSIKTIKRIISFNGIFNESLEKTKTNSKAGVKNKLTLEELNLISDFQIEPGTKMYHSRNIFLVQFYLRGMRIGDCLRMTTTDIVGNRLIYQASKNSVRFDMKIVEPCMMILNEYLTNRTPGYVFPFIKRDKDLCDVKTYRREIKNRTNQINGNLKLIAKELGINKDITSHIARHSFGIIADKKTGGNLRELQALFGHSSRAITERYINELRKTDDLDDFADKVLL